MMLAGTKVPPLVLWALAAVLLVFVLPRLGFNLFGGTA